MDAQARYKNGKFPKPDAGVEQYTFGKMQPQALELEQAVLGAIMLDREAFAVVVDILTPECFYTEGHGKIFSAFMRLFAQGEPIDILTTTQEVMKGGDLDTVGGAYYITDLSNRVASSANLEYHARIVKEKWMRREAIRVASNTIRDAYEETEDTFSLLEQAERGLFNIVQGRGSRSAQPASAFMLQSIRKLERAMKSDGLTGVPSGFGRLDRFTGGWQPTDLIILAARPGMGKTAAVMAFILNAARDYKRPIAFFSLEMSGEQLSDRILALQTRVDLHRLRRGKVTDMEMQEVEKAQTAFNAPLFIDDTPALSVFDLRARARRMKMQHDIQMVVVDYMQLMRGEGGGNREQEISSISRGLKALAKELNVPVIALSQLSRAVEIRGGAKRPQLSDLRESGSIEQDADSVVFIYRPKYYDITEDENGQSVETLAEFIFAKHRNGPVDTVKLEFDERSARFYDPDEVGVSPMEQPGPSPTATAVNLNQPIPRMNEEDIPF